MNSSESGCHDGDTGKFLILLMYKSKTLVVDTIFINFMFGKCASMRMCKPNVKDVLF